MKASPLHAITKVIIIGLHLALGPSLGNAATVPVTVGDGGFFFFPSSVTIQVGDTVQWTWAATGHSSTSGPAGSPNGLWDSGILNKGATFSFTFNAAGSFPYHCSPHGVCCGMTGTVTVSAPTPTPTPTATPTPTSTPTPTPTATASPTPTPSPSATPATTTFANISTRLRVETGDNVLIGGFIITGTQAKKVMVRGIGSSLPLVGVLADPVLELHDGTGALVASNDNWMDAPNKQEIIDSTIAPANDFESAILMTLDPGLYTAIVRGVNDTTGIALIEAYDLELTTDSILANISTRGLVQTGDDVMIGGIIILGTDPQEVLLRAIGPSLPLPGALADPSLELHDKDGVTIATNDDWRSDQEAEIMATTLPPADDAESAILMTLTPDAYTAIVRGKDNSTGVALVEAYQLDN